MIKSHFYTIGSKKEYHQSDAKRRRSHEKDNLTDYFYFSNQYMAIPKPSRGRDWKYKIVMYFTRAEYAPIPAMEGLAYALFEYKGLSFWENGETSFYSGAAIGEFYKGKGPVRNCVVHTFADGSTIVSQNRFINISAPDGKSSSYEDITGEIVKGTGRFEGIKGTTAGKGKRLGPISPGLKEMRGDAVVEGSMTFTLPSK
jgi:hypothetical protein